MAGLNRLLEPTFPCNEVHRELQLKRMSPSSRAHFKIKLDSGRVLVPLTLERVRKLVIKGAIKGNETGRELPSRWRVEADCPDPCSVRSLCSSRAGTDRRKQSRAFASPAQRGARSDQSPACADADHASRADSDSARPCGSDQAFAWRGSAHDSPDRGGKLSLEKQARRDTYRRAHNRSWREQRRVDTRHEKRWQRDRWQRRPHDVPPSRTPGVSQSPRKSRKDQENKARVA